MLVHPVAVSHLRGLVDQRGAVAQEDSTLALLHGLVAHTQAEVGLPGTRRGHDDLVLVALFEPLTQGVMCRNLEVAGGGESIIALTRR